MNDKHQFLIPALIFAVAVSIFGGFLATRAQMVGWLRPSPDPTLQSPGNTILGNTATNTTMINGLVTATGGAIFNTAMPSAPTGLIVASGNVGIGTMTPDPAYALDVNGKIRSSNGGFVFPDGSTQITAGGGGGGYWNLSGNFLSTSDSSNMVGIGGGATKGYKVISETNPVTSTPSCACDTSTTAYNCTYSYFPLQLASEPIGSICYDINTTNNNAYQFVVVPTQALISVFNNSVEIGRLQAKSSGSAGKLRIISDDNGVGLSVSGGGGNSYGISAVGSGSGAGVVTSVGAAGADGIYGINNYSTGNAIHGAAFIGGRAGYFEGPVTITGALTVSGGCAGCGGGAGSTAWADITGKPAGFADNVDDVGGASSDGLGTGNSGTANYLTKWTGSTAIGNSVIQDNGTYVGIGTAPLSGYKLNVEAAVGSIDRGIRGVSISEQGVTGISTSGTGVYGSGLSAGIGVHGISTNGTGVLGQSSTGRAGYFQGKVEVTGDIKIGSSTATCDASNAGRIEFGNSNFYGCDGTSWRPLNYSAPCSGRCF